MIIEPKHETVGAASIRALKDYNPDQTIIDTQRAMQKGYLDELAVCAKRGEELYGRSKHFYLCVQNRSERILKNVLRSQFYPRETRPTPAIDLTLYYYEPKDEQIIFVWCVPDKATVDRLGGHWFDDEGTMIFIPPQAPQPGEEQLASFCRSFVAGTLV